jgi:hypothetical protein
MRDTRGAIGGQEQHPGKTPKGSERTRWHRSVVLLGGIIMEWDGRERGGGLLRARIFIPTGHHQSSPTCCCSRLHAQEDRQRGNQEANNWRGGQDYRVRKRRGIRST